MCCVNAVVSFLKNNIWIINDEVNGRDVTPKLCQLPTTQCIYLLEMCLSYLLLLLLLLLLVLLFVETTGQRIYLSQCICYCWWFRYCCCCYLCCCCFANVVGVAVFYLYILSVHNCVCFYKQHNVHFYCFTNALSHRNVALLN